MTTYLIISLILALYTLIVFPSMEERHKHPDVHAIWVILVLLFFWALPVFYFADFLAKLIDVFETTDMDDDEEEEED